MCSLTKSNLMLRASAPSCCDEAVSVHHVGSNIVDQRQERESCQLQMLPHASLPILTLHPFLGFQHLLRHLSILELQMQSTLQNRSLLHIACLDDNRRVFCCTWCCLQGWKDLVQGFCNAFKPSDPVVLWILAKPFDQSGVVSIMLPNSRASLNSERVELEDAACIVSLHIVKYFSHSSKRKYSGLGQGCWMHLQVYLTGHRAFCTP